jgi:hypothetical protein
MGSEVSVVGALVRQLAEEADHEAGRGEQANRAAPQERASASHVRSPPA